MSDDLGLLGGHPDDDRGPGDRGAPPGRRAARRSSRGDRRRVVARRRRRVGTVLAVVVLIAVAGGVYLGGRALLGSFSTPETPDFAGPAGPDTVVEVARGDTSTQIGTTLADRGVVASPAAFSEAAIGTAGISSVQPGFYVLPTSVPGSQAVADLLDPASRVGQLVIPEGRQLDDVTGSTGVVTPGILSLLAEASCATLDGTRSCVDVADLRAAAGAAPAELDVPEFATAEVAGDVDPVKRLEGLVRPGSYNVSPRLPATELLASVISSSASSFQALGLPEASPGGLDPYQVLTVASLVEREALPDDFAKVARVIYNRLAVDQKLEFDSTVNYPLDVQAIATTDAARAEVTPWNTYASPGLPRTPISSPGDAALTAAENPAEGAWLYFVTIDQQGTTVFSNTFPEHEAAIEIARANGVFG